MKKYISIIIFLFISTLCYPQQCLTDEYFQKSKNKDPQLEKKIKNVISSFKNNETNVTKKLSATNEIIGEEIIVIPVVFNVIHSGEPVGTGKNLSINKIEEQINILNEFYSGKYGGVDTRIRFCLAKQNTVGQATTGVNRFFGNASYDIGIEVKGECIFNFEVDKELKKNVSAGFPSSFYLNIWTTNIIECKKDNYLGYGTYPFYEDFSVDGIVLDYLQVGINVTVNVNDPNYSNGSTLVHEAGHWLGLFHVFEGFDADESDSILESCRKRSDIPCDLEGDMICDTDLVRSDGTTNIAAGNCLGYKCNGQTTTVVQNIMDYQIPSRYYCQTKFTLGQKKRMKSILSYYRPSIYNQGMIMDLISCKTTSMSGGGGGGCSEDITLPVQKIIKPAVYQDLSQLYGTSVKFGQRLEVNDKWLVTIFNTTAYYPAGTPPPNIPIENSLVIYKREGCKFALHQMIDMRFNNTQQNTDFGLLLNGNEIIVSSAVNDEVNICRLNESKDKWDIVQTIKNITAESQVGTSTYTIGRFLFVLENNKNTNNIFRVYYKNDNGTYVFHQNIAISGFRLPSFGKYIQSGNFRKTIVNFNSSTFTGSYDPPELLVSKSNGTGLVLLELNNNNMWTHTGTIQPVGMPTTEITYDIELSKDYIHILTSANTTGAPNHDVLYLYSYKITDRWGSNFPFQNVYNKQALINITDRIYSDTKLQVFNDQFLFIDNIKSQPLGLFYNSNFGTTSLPNWQRKGSKKITCSNSDGQPDDFEVFGNLLFYGYGGSWIHIYNMSDILIREGYDQTFINNSDFYNKKINVVPDNYTTSAQKITISESLPVVFNYVEKEFVANTRIILKPGTKLSSGSKVKLKISDNYGLCNTLLTSKKSNVESDIINDFLSEREDEMYYKTQEKTILYPNPNTGIFTVYLGKENNKPINCNIYDSTGQLVYQSITEKSTIEISLSNLPSGNYIINLSGDNLKESIKFIKQ
ncbi:zinc-dependent metalloprotease [Flavobacterium pectinovorum]|uniref:T9SS C-terminal target domain-containing protein n=1 Tax=Flavobacterium pectinovorum TaxID=29533 RepID=A0A502F389_9FLAO|nr:zinc-dependent metalloprotease [Flavobacterium pectinovorum]TPG44665.1 T9SS C-terminal target domain-containing protein [Flavobacterium pectinovorum]